MKIMDEYKNMLPLIAISLAISWALNLFLLFFFLLYLIIANIIDYRILKSFYLKKQKWDLNICCGDTDGGGINADIIKRKVPNFVLIKNIYKLPFKDKEFKNVLCSHTMEHIENPYKFYKELKRISKGVVLLIPPVWDIGCFLNFREHKWQFLTFKSKHSNLPSKIKLPFWWHQELFGQKI